MHTEINSAALFSRPRAILLESEPWILGATLQHKINKALVIFIVIPTIFRITFLS